MNNAEKLEKVADYFRSIGCLYVELVSMTEQIECICVDEARGYSARVFEQEKLWQCLQDLKQKAQDTPPPFLPPVDKYGLPPIPEGDAPILVGVHDAGALPMAKDDAETLGEIAFSCWRQLDCDLRQLEGDLFGGKEVWITGKSSYPLIQLEAQNSARREIYHQRKARLDDWAEVARKMLANEAASKIAEAEAKKYVAQGEMEKAIAAQKVAEEKAELAKRLEANFEITAKRLESNIKNGIQEFEKRIIQAMPEKPRKGRNVASPETYKEAFAKMAQHIKHGREKGVAAELVMIEFENKGTPLYATHYESLSDKQKQNRRYSFVRKYNHYMEAQREATRKAKTNGGA